MAPGDCHAPSSPLAGGDTSPLHINSAYDSPPVVTGHPAAKKLRDAQDDASVSDGVFQRLPRVCRGTMLSAQFCWLATSPSYLALALGCDQD